MESLKKKNAAHAEDTGRRQQSSGNAEQKPCAKKQINKACDVEGEEMDPEQPQQESIQVGRQRSVGVPNVTIEKLAFGELGGDINFAAAIDQIGRASCR